MDRFTCCRSDPIRPAVNALLAMLRLPARWLPRGRWGEGAAVAGGGGLLLSLTGSSLAGGPSPASANRDWPHPQARWGGGQGGRD